MKHTALAILLACACACAGAAAQNQPWLDKTRPADERARAAVAAMTLDEKLLLIMGYSGGMDLMIQPDEIVPRSIKAEVQAQHIKGSAGYVPGVPRLGIPPQKQTDASIGVRVDQVGRTALPSPLATAASFDPEVAEAGGRMIALEARSSGFNVLLAGGANLTREPRNGRNFEYVGEDPLLAGQMAAASIRGIQSRHMVSTMKHFAINNQETQRTTADVVISAQAMRQSELLAFEMIHELSTPGAVMCSYNLVNGQWACENDYLLNQTLKRDWGFKGYVMADWGAVHSTADAINNGLDQFTGYPCCNHHGPTFAAKYVKQALASGAVTQQRLDDMAVRILWPLFETGSFDRPSRIAPIDFKANAAVARHTAEQSLVLLKNEHGLLPLTGVKSLAVIGGHADKGVLSGGGSSAVNPVGGNAVPGLAPLTWPGPVVYLPSAPLAALKADLPKTRVTYSNGDDLAAAVALAQRSDVAIVFVTQWMGETLDGRLELDPRQDALVAAVARANPKTVVVVESGGAVLMPWLAQVPAVLQAFYPGARGGEAISRILTGKVNPSGRLPLSFPASTRQLAQAELPGFGQPDGTPVQVRYDDGAAIGYKWYDAQGIKPLFAFGHGLSYTRFDVTAPAASFANGKLVVGGTVRNVGKLGGKAVAQVYVAPVDWKAAGWEAPKRLVAFSKLDLRPGDAKAFQHTVDPRLLATYVAADNSWRIKAGSYRVLLGQAADDLPLSLDVTLPEITWSAVHSQQ